MLLPLIVYQSMFTIKRWDQFTTTVNFTNSDWTATDITWCTVFFIVRTTENPTSTDDEDSTVIFKKDITVHSNAVWWIKTIPLLSTDRDITPWTYYRELQILFTNNDIRSANTGIFNVLPDLNKRVW